MDLCLVVPTYNEERRILRALETLSSFARSSRMSIEVVIADDGSKDRTVEIAQRWASEHAHQSFAVRVEPIRHRGKGAAVRAGMSDISATVVGYTDVDLSAGLDALESLLARLREGADVVIASRALPESVLVKRQPFYREMAGRVYNLILRLLTGAPFRDTQCGLKLFRLDVARRLFQLQRIDGFAFDAELVVLAMRLGYRVEEVPVRWTHDEGSKMSMARDSLRMARDLLRIVRRLRRGSIVAPGVPTTAAMKQMTSTEDYHWWHTSKRIMVRDLLRRAGPKASVLDLGCGGGAMLASAGQDRFAVGVDLSSQALGHARSRGLRRLVSAEAAALPFADGSFGAAVALDVVEHHAQPEQLLAEVRRVLVPGGLLIVTVPAFQWMWSYADVVLGHYRRYVRAELADEISVAGFTLERVTYFHSWLLPVAWVFRKLRALVGKGKSSDDFPLPGPLNYVLFKLARLEGRVAGKRDLPFGLSLLAVARTEEDIGERDSSVAAPA